MSVPRWHVRTDILEDCYLAFHTYDSACMMHSCMICQGIITLLTVRNCACANGPLLLVIRIFGWCLQISTHFKAKTEFRK